jgi:hypothetical protein
VTGGGTYSDLVADWSDQSHCAFTLVSQDISDWSMAYFDASEPRPFLVAQLTIKQCHNVPALAEWILYPHMVPQYIVWHCPAPRGCPAWYGGHCTQIDQHGQLTAVHVGTVYCRRPYSVTYMHMYCAVRPLGSGHRNCE